MNEASGPDEAQLADAACRGDRAAFEALVRLHKATLYRIARRFVGNADDAYDLLQEAFVSAYLSRSRFNSTQAFGPWIRTILLNKCRDFTRRRAVKRRLLQWLTLGASEKINAGFAAPDDPPEGDRDSRLGALDHAIAELPARYKEPLLLTAFEGLSHRDVATQLGLTSKAVELRIRRARQRLRDQLLKRER